jgi:hypothetical protein
LRDFIGVEVGGDQLVIFVGIARSKRHSVLPR